MEAVRSAEPADLDALEDLVGRAIDELGAMRGGAVWSRREARSAPFGERLRTELSRPEHEGALVVGTIDGTVVGYGAMHYESLHDGTTLAVVDDIYVHHGARGVGVGEELLGELVERATKQGAVGIDSIALPGDRETKNFFETFGLKARAILVHRPLPAAGEEAADQGGVQE